MRLVDVPDIAPEMAVVLDAIIAKYDRAPGSQLPIEDRIAGAVLDAWLAATVPSVRTAWLRDIDASSSGDR